LAGALLFNEKIHQSAALVWIILRDVGNEFFKYSTHEPISKEQLLTSPGSFKEPVKV
jgi:hypothetical protein